MTQRRDSHRSPSKTLGQHVLLLQGVGWLSTMSFLTSGIALAQSSSPSEPIVVPSAQDLLMPEAQTAPDPAPFVAPAPASPAPASPAPVIIPSNPTPSVSAEPERFVPENSASQTSSPFNGAATAPQGNVPETSNSQRSSQTRDASNIYIDATNYNLGATNTYSRPDSIVLSERSTGCQTVLQGGQSVASNLCSQGNPNASQVAASGNGQSVNIGPLRLSSNGFGVGQTTPSGQDYYSRTVRPTALPGNGNTALMFPLSIPSVITSAFGWRIHPISGDQRFHSGTDIGAPLGTPVVAAFAGRVSISDFLGGYGLTVVLKHDDTQETLYAHLSELFVRPGDWIEQGEVIGRVGSTGNSTGPHLHFEFRQLTSEGWLAMDAGEVLQYALARLVRGDYTAQLPPLPETAQAQAAPETNGIGGPVMGTLHSGKVATKATTASLPTFAERILEEATYLSSVPAE